MISFSNNFRQWLCKFGLAVFLAILPISIFIAFLSVTPSTASSEMSRPPEFVEQDGDSWNVYLYAIPDPDGASLNVAAENVSDSCPDDDPAQEVNFRVWYGGFTVFLPVFFKNGSNNITTLEEGPETSPNIPGTADEDKVEAFAEYPGIPVPDEDKYVANIPDFFPLCQSPPCTAVQRGSIEVTCKNPHLNSRTLNFRRYYAPSGQETTIVSPDTLAELKTLTSTFSITGHYVIVMPAKALPAPLPLSVTGTFTTYVFNSSATSNSSDGNMRLTLRYSNNLLGEADPLNVRIYEWAPGVGVSGTWRDIGKQSHWHNGNQRIVGKTTKNFTVYTLVISPLWCDDFSDSEGLNLEQSNNITTHNKLRLENTSQPGMALSRSYTPSMMFDAWQKITYSAKVPPEATLIISVLDGNGNTVLMPHINSGDSLTNINPSTYPSLTLRAAMSPTADGQSPNLFYWCVRVKPHIFTSKPPIFPYSRPNPPLPTTRLGGR